MFNFYISVFACVSVSLCLCVFLLVFVCTYVSPVASVLSAFVMYLVWLCFSKTIRVIHCFYPLKNPCQREESLLGILSLESQTSKFKLKILNGSLSYSLLFVISSHYIIVRFFVSLVDLLRFSVPERTEEIAALWSARWDQYPVTHYGVMFYIYCS